MSKKKKKLAHLNKQQKDSEAQFKKDYISRFRDFVYLIGKGHCYELLRPDLLDELYRTRVYGIRVVPAEGVQVSAANLKEFQRLMVMYAKSIPGELPGIEGKPTSYELLMGSLAVLHLLQHEFRGRETVDAELGDLLVPEGKEVPGLVNVLHQAFTLGLEISDYFSRIYYFVISYPKVLPSPMIFELHRADVPSRSFTVDGVRRKASRLGIPRIQEGITWLELPPESFGKNPRKHKPVHVYFQSHAVDRYFERADMGSRAILHLSIFDSFKHLDLSREDHSREYFIPLRILDMKVGYFLGSLVEGHLLIRTFLLLPMDGTPESKELKRLTGMLKADIQYLHIDRLSTFMSSDLDKDPTLRSLFEQAGCGELFLIKDHWNVGLPQQRIAEEFRKYLLLNEAEESTEEFEEEDGEAEALAPAVKPLKEKPQQ